MDGAVRRWLGFRRATGPPASRSRRRRRSALKAARSGPPTRRGSTRHDAASLPRSRTRNVTPRGRQVGPASSSPSRRRLPRAFTTLHRRARDADSGRRTRRRRRSPLRCARRRTDVACAPPRRGLPRRAAASVGWRRHVPRDGAARRHDRPDHPRPVRRGRVQLDSVPAAGLQRGRGPRCAGRLQRRQPVRRRARLPDLCGRRVERRPSRRPGLRRAHPRRTHGVRDGCCGRPDGARRGHRPRSRQRDVHRARHHRYRYRRDPERERRRELAACRVRRRVRPTDRRCGNQLRRCGPGCAGHARAVQRATVDLLPVRRPGHRQPEHVGPRRGIRDRSADLRRRERRRHCAVLGQLGARQDRRGRL